MATDVLDERRFQNQCSLYESNFAQSSQQRRRQPTTHVTAKLRPTTSVPSAVITQRRAPLTAQPSVAPSNHVTSHRHSVSSDFISLLRSLAMKPFRTTSTSPPASDGQTNPSLSNHNLQAKASVSLLKYRPLSDRVTDHASHIQSTRVCIKINECDSAGVGVCTQIHVYNH